MTHFVKTPGRRIQLEVELPELPKHHHAGVCTCEPTLGYVRVSKVGGREDIKSPKIQVRHIVDDAKRNDKRIVKLVFDINKSGYTRVKRSIDEVVRDIEAGIARSVTVWKWSRWGRNRNLTLLYDERVQRAGGRVDSATEDTDPRTASGALNRDVIMAIDQHQSRVMGENWQNVFAFRREAGLPLSGRDRFGYQYFTKEMIRSGVTHEGTEHCEDCRLVRAHFVIDPVEGPALKSVYELYNSKKSIRWLCKYLNDKGLVTVFGSPWTPQGLGQMLDTGFAAGYLRERSAAQIQVQKDQNKRVRNSLKSFDVWRKGQHPAIIDDATWIRYKGRRLSQANLPPRSRVAVHELSSLLVCAICARRMTTKYSGTNRSHQWVCSWTKSMHPGISVTISNRLATEVVRSWVQSRKHSATRSLAERIEAQVSRAMADARTVAQIKREIDRFEKKIDLLLEGFTDGAVKRDAYKAKSAEFESEIARLHEELADLEAETSPTSHPKAEAFESIETVWGAVAPTDLNAALQAVIGMVVVSPTDQPRARAGAADRLTVVGRWELDEWDSWFTERRTKAFAQA